MVRLEKIDLSEKSWWAAAGTPHPDLHRDFELIKTVSASCLSCKETNQEIFTQGWTCLNTSCPNFFNFPCHATLGSTDFVDSFLYSRDFVQKRTRFQGKISQDLVPKLPEVDKIGTVTRGCETVFGEGVVCSSCSGCTRRRKWNRWECENGCDWKLLAPPAVTSVKDSLSDKPQKAIELCSPLVQKNQIQVPGGKYDVFEYKLPGEAEGSTAGSIWHFQANSTVQRQPNGPDDLFRGMQESDLGLDRSAVRNKDCKSSY